ncbi:MAG: RidA family protein [Acidobacteriaceae bacterium]
MSHRIHSALVLLMLSVSTVVASAQSPGFKVIQPPGSDPAYSAGLLANGTLYFSGQGSTAQGVSAQMKDAMGKVQTVLRGAGLNFGDVVWLNIYLTDNKDLPAMDDVYWQMIGSSPPARTVLTVAALPAGEKVEINGIAVAGDHKSIWPAGWPQGPRVDPPAIQAGEMLYLSAQGGKTDSDFSTETRQALENVNAVLNAANMSMKNVLWVNPYMTAGGQYDVMGKVYRTFFEFGNTPGRGTIQVVGLPKGQHIVFSCIAGSDLSKRKAVRPRNMPPSPTASPGILYGDTLYLSAKDGFIPGQGMVTQLFDLQTRQSMRNLLDGLEEVDMDFTNVVFSTVYLREMKDLSQMNELYNKFLKPPYPARTILQQNFETGEEAAEQISFIAVRRQPAKAEEATSSGPKHTPTGWAAHH